MVEETGAEWLGAGTTTDCVAGAQEVRIKAKTIKKYFIWIQTARWRNFKSKTQFYIYGLASLLAFYGSKLPIPYFVTYTPVMEDIYKTYLHAPPHYFVPNAVYMVTGSIVHKQPILREDKFKEFFLKTLFEKAGIVGWVMEAWAVLHNHYHFIAQSPENVQTLPKFIQQVHSITAIQFNRWDKTSGRQVWQNYWDTCITHEKSYLARLRYVHENPVKHGLVDNAVDYPFCSYKWFIEQGDEELKEQVHHQPIDKVNVYDDF